MNLLMFIIAEMLLGFCVGFIAGYAKREKEFQERPTVFVSEGESVIRVYREPSGLKIKIYNEKLVEIIK